MEDTTYRWPPQDDGQNPKPKKPLPDIKKLASRLIIAALAIAIGMAAMTCFYTVDDKQQAVVTTFGKVTDVTDAGVHFKLPMRRRLSSVWASFRSVSSLRWRYLEMPAASSKISRRSALFRERISSILPWPILE